MKKIILFIGLCLLSVGLFAQSTFRTGIRVADSFLPTTNGGVAIGSTARQFSGAFLFTGGVINWDNGDLTLTHTANTITLGGGDMALGSNNLTLTGSIATTGSRSAKGWFTNLEITNLPTVNGGTLKTALSLTATDVGLGNVTNESKATMFTNATFTGTTGGITATMVGLGNVTNKAQVELEDSALMAGGYTSYADGIAGLALKLNKADSGVWAGGYVTPKDLDVAIGVLEDTVALETIVNLQSDTIPLFVFGAGAGNDADSNSFTTSSVYGAFYNKGSDTLIITELRAVMLAGATPLGTDTLSIQVYWNDTINATGVSCTLLNASPLGINSITVGTVDASFAASTIPPNVWVFCKTPGVVTGRKPEALFITLSGHKQNRRY